MDQLSSIDASFLHLETPETPMHVGSLMLFELPDGYKGDYYEDVKALLGKRLHLSSFLNRKLAQMPFQLAEPVWIEDDDIELDYHVRTVTLRRPGTMAQLEQLVARLHASLLDRSRPLWEMYVIDGLENGLVAFYTKAHHSGVDGKAGVELAKVLYDTSAQIREVPPPRRKRTSGQYQLGVTELLQAAATNAAQQYRKLAELLPTAAKAFDAAAKVVTSQRSGKGERSLNLGLAPNTVFNDSITNQRSYSTMSLPLADIKELGRRVGGTVNTIVMAMCSIALHHFLKERGLLPNEPLIAMVPVSLRTEGDKAMNNQVAAKAVVKELKPVLGVDIPITGSPWLMTGLASLLGRSNLVSRFPAAGNVLISNVPGPPMTLYMAGAKMVHYFPVSIPYHGSALNITVQSYAGSLEFGLTACRRILSQDESYELTDHLRTALREIQALPPVDATVKPARSALNEPDKVSTESKSVAPAPSVVVPQAPAVAKEVASIESGSGLKPSTTGLTRSPRRGRRRMPHSGN
jgi:diacylglycerol O-acyltransferase